MEDIAAPTPPPDAARRIRAEIERFLREERLQPKLDKLKPDEYEAREALIKAHQPSVWISDAAKRVGQIQQVTHAIKFTHPSARGTSLFSRGNCMEQESVWGTHSFSDEIQPDLAGNAGAMDIAGFLALSVDGRNILQRTMSRDPELLMAFQGYSDSALDWIESFAAVTSIRGEIASHKLGKQTYWPLEDGGYHLIGPLQSSVMAHALYTRVRSDLFSDIALAARKAKRNHEADPNGYRDYPNLVIQSLGGKSAQKQLNVSLLNKERHGENFLLASLPPLWESPTLRPPLKTDSVFLRYYPYRREVRRLAGVLKDYLRSVAHRRSNVHIRYTRTSLVSELVDEVLNMAAELHRGLEPGWTAQPDCQLRLAEQRWLDPQRSETDEAFAARIHGDGWKDEVCKGFAGWLNSAVQTDKTAFGEDEAREWEMAMKREIKLLREELADE